MTNQQKTVLIWSSVNFPVNMYEMVSLSKESWTLRDIPNDISNNMIGRGWTEIQTLKY